MDRMVLSIKDILCCKDISEKELNGRLLGYVDSVRFGLNYNYKMQDRITIFTNKYLQKSFFVKNLYQNFCRVMDLFSIALPIFFSNNFKQLNSPRSSVDRAMDS
jgi:hypothetical protein